MRSPLLITLLLPFTTCLTHAQTKNPPEKPAPSGKARFSPEAIELFTGTSSGYELNGKQTAVALDAAAMLKAAQSKDPKVQELGHLACRLLYLHSLVRKETPDPEIAKLVKADGFEFVKEELDKFVNGRKTNFTPEEIKNLVNGVKAISAAVTGDGKQLENVLFTEPQKEQNRLKLLGVIGQSQGLAYKEKLRGMVGEPTRPLPAIKDPIKVKLESKDKVAYMVATNETKATLHHCLLFTRAINDPAKVDVRLNGEMRKYALGAAFFQASKDALAAASTSVLLNMVLLSMDRGSIVYIPEIPAGATVRIGLMAEADMEQVKNTELSLYCDELTVASLNAGTLNKLMAAAATPIKLDSRGAAEVKFQLAKDDPRDPLAVGAKMCKVFTLPMTAGKTYTIKVTTTQYGTDLRVEDALGEVMIKSPKSSSFKEKTIQVEYTPTADGTYRIVASEAYSGRNPFTLNVQRK
jgi:hypothetical protein